MIKYIILLFNLMGLFLYQLFFQANVTATQNVPASANAGSSFVVEVTINKADASGFAKYQEDLPAGFTATAVEKQGATVLSSDNAIKFIWASLPSEGSFKIAFRINVDPSMASGTQSVSGKFLYVVNNERQEADVAPSSITISGTAPVAAATPAPDTTKQSPVAVAPTPAVTPQPVTPPASDVTSQPVTSAPAVAAAPVTVTVPSAPPATIPAPAAAPASVNITRSFSASTVNQAADLMVSLTIHKGNLSGFAKMEESIPDNLVIADGDNQGASFTFVDNKVKFVWLNLPSDSVFTVSYKISVGSTVSGNQSIGGEFSYLADNNAIKVSVPATSFMVQNTSQPVAVTQPAVTPQPVTPAPVEPAPAPVVSQPVAVAPQPVMPTPVATPEPVAPAPAVASQPVAANPPAPVASTDMANTITPHVGGASKGVKYRVQIMALHNPVKSTYLAKKFNISETINEEMLEGYTKYTVGRFNEYKSVHDHREEIRSKGVDGPFVVAYNGGKRITVQEALMITHQQWYK